MLSSRGDAELGVIIEQTFKDAIQYYISKLLEGIREIETQVQNCERPLKAAIEKLLHVGRVAREISERLDIYREFFEFSAATSRSSSARKSAYQPNRTETGPGLLHVYRESHSLWISHICEAVGSRLIKQLEAHTVSHPVKLTALWECIFVLN